MYRKCVFISHWNLILVSGKQLFLQDNTFDDSDVRFLEEESDNVEVDESLFDDLDDLDLDGELDDIES